MPGHGDPILQTFDQWIVRTNKRIARLERRQARPGGGSDVTLPGTVVLWAAPVIPPGWVVLDGTAYPVEEVPRLAALFGATGTFTTPDVPAPTGLVYIMRT